jgi:hypothetical protein
MRKELETEMGIDDITLCDAPVEKREYATIEECYTIENNKIVLKDTCIDKIFKND